MIKFQLFDSADSYQCHFAEISTFVVSIAHYMRAYFNYQALVDGKDFTLPDDAAYLNVSDERPLALSVDDSVLTNPFSTSLFAVHSTGLYRI
jgi:hypothetical protein